jgi:hypothetical protein
MKTAFLRAHLTFSSIGTGVLIMLLLILMLRARREKARVSLVVASSKTVQCACCRAREPCCTSTLCRRKHRSQQVWSFVLRCARVLRQSALALLRHTLCSSLNRQQDYWRIATAALNLGKCRLPAGLVCVVARGQRRRTCGSDLHRLCMTHQRMRRRPAFVCSRCQPQVLSSLPPTGTAACRTLMPRASYPLSARKKNNHDHQKQPLKRFFVPPMRST